MYKKIRKREASVQKNTLCEQQKSFILRHVPRLHRLLMEAFPGMRETFGYELITVEDHGVPSKLVLRRKKRVVATKVLQTGA